MRPEMYARTHQTQVVETRDIGSWTVAQTRIGELLVFEECPPGVQSRGPYS
jgi:hypothetical protein